MSSEAIYEKLKEIIIRNLDVSDSSITLDTNIVKDLGVDSLDIVELVLDVEEVFDIVVADEDLVSLKTIGDAVLYIKKEIMLINE